MLISTLVWPSLAVEKIWLFCVGMVVLRSISLVEDAAERLDAQRERRHVQQQHVADLAGQHARLNAGANRHHLVGVDTLVRLFLVEDALDDRLHGGHARHAADQHHFVDLGRLDPGVIERACTTGSRVFSTRSSTNCSSLARVSVTARCFGPLWSAVMNGRLISVCMRRRQLFLGLLRRFLQTLERHLVLAQVDALVAAELVGQPVDDALVEVVAAQVGVAVGRLHLEDALAQLQDRDIEGAAAQVIDGDALVLLLIQAIGQRGGGRLVDDALDFQAGDACRRLWWPGAGRR